MIPVLARSAERSASDPAEKAHVGQISSALLTWSVVILVPLTLVIAAVAGPVASLLNPGNANAHCVRADVVNATSHMLVVFAPQVILYGLSVVLYGLLQAHRRFTGPAVGPAVASLVVIASCLAFVPLGRGFRCLSCRCRPSLCCRWAARSASPRSWPWAWCRRGGCTCGSGLPCGSRPGWPAGRPAWRWSA